MHDWQRSADARASRQVGPVWDGSSDEAQGEWQSKVDNADVLIMGKYALVGLGNCHSY